MNKYGIGLNKFNYLCTVILLEQVSLWNHGLYNTILVGQKTTCTCPFTDLTAGR